MVQVNPADPQFQVCLGIALHAAGRPDDAIATWKQAIAQPDNAGQGTAQSGEIYWELGRIEDSLVACRKAISLRPDLPKPTTTWETPFAPRRASCKKPTPPQRRDRYQPTSPSPTITSVITLSTWGVRRSCSPYDRAIALKMAEPQGQRPHPGSRTTFPASTPPQSTRNFAAGTTNSPNRCNI